MKTDTECTAQAAVGPLVGFAFTADWVAEAPAARKHLAGTQELLARRLEALKQTPWTPWGADEVEAVAEYNRQAGNDAGAGLAGRLGEPDCLVVVTGQQPDFLAAPLYVLHKALSACAWAEKLSVELERTVVPVFWVASDDHDFAELKQARVVDIEGAVQDVGGRISRGKGIGSGSPAYLWNLDESRGRVEEDLAANLGSWPGLSGLVDELVAELRGESSFEVLFCRLLTKLLGPKHSMVFVAPKLLPFRRRQADLLSRDVPMHSDANRLVNGAAAALEHAGYPPMLQRDEPALNFFWINEGARHRLVRRGEVIQVMGASSARVLQELTEPELLQMIESAPGDFLPNVVTRPVLQDVVLPNLLYVAGPGEMAYLAQLGPVYEAFGVERSAVTPRSFVTLTDGGAHPAPADCAEALLANGGAQAAQALSILNDLNIAAAEKLQALDKTVSQNAAAGVAVEKTRRHIYHGLQQLQRRLARQIEPDACFRLARRAALHAPLGAPQERVLAPWNFVKPGQWSALADHLAEAVDYTSSQPQSVALPTWVEAML